MNIEWISSPNYQIGRPFGIEHIVIHTIEGSLNSAINWFLNPNSKASAHELLSEDGLRIVQMVWPEDRAWHAGTVKDVDKIGFWGDENENERSIGFELEGYAKDERPQAQVATLVERCKLYIKQYNIKIDRVNIVGHYQLSSDRSDPGELFPWDWFMNQLKKEFELNNYIIQEFFESGGIGANTSSGIYQSWKAELQAGRNRGSAMVDEFQYNDGKTYQYFTCGISCYDPATDEVTWN